MPRNPGQTVALTLSEAAAHKEQAAEYLRAAQYSMSVGDFNAAAGAAVDAGINAADAVAGVNLGQRWKGPHDQAADFVAKAGPEGKEIARHLRRLLPLKTQSLRSHRGLRDQGACSRRGSRTCPGSGPPRHRSSLN